MLSPIIRYQPLTVPSNIVQANEILTSSLWFQTLVFLNINTFYNFIRTFWLISSEWLFEVWFANLHKQLNDTLITHIKTLSISFLSAKSNSPLFIEPANDRQEPPYFSVRVRHFSTLWLGLWAKLLYADIWKKLQRKCWNFRKTLCSRKRVGEPRLTSSDHQDPRG